MWKTLDLSFTGKLAVTGGSTVVAVLDFFIFQGRVAICRVYAISFVPSKIGNAFFISYRFVLNADR